MIPARVEVVKSIRNVVEKTHKKGIQRIEIRKCIYLAGFMMLCMVLGCGWKQAAEEKEDSSTVRQFVVPEEDAVYLVSISEEAGIQKEVSASEEVPEPQETSESEVHSPLEESSPSEEVPVQTVSGNAVGNLSAEAGEAFSRVNQARLEIGLSELVWSDELAAAAEVRAQEIHQSFSHTRPDGSPWWTVDSENIYGENIAKGYQSADSVVTAWMESSDHKENILYSGFESIGIAVYNVDGKWYWAQEFGY